jgi:hypothetical protein
MEILDNIPYEITPGQVVELLRPRKKNPSIEKSIEQLIHAVQPVANPKALYKACYIDNAGEDSVEIEGICFTSRILRKNLEHTGRVFPYVVTCGKELDTIEASKNDIMEKFCLDTIKEFILVSAHIHLEEHLKDKYSITRISHMNPGSLDDWPMEQQKQIFSILGDVENLIGVRLKESYLMDPIKTVSGIYFPTVIDFKSCMLCPRQNCSHRRAEYDPAMLREYKK